jgi:hypothetical protein
MKRFLIGLSFIIYHLSFCIAQTVLSPYRPGVTSEGAVYFLPKTAVRITVQVEKTTYTPGDFSKYADRYLRLKDVSQEPSVEYRITTIRQEPIAVADTTKVFAVKFDPKTVAPNVALSDDGILLAINATPNAITPQPVFTPAPRPKAVNPRQYMNEETLAAGSTAKMAELVARDIYDIRESRNLLVRGQADNMPKDGAQLKLMLNSLDQQDHSLTSLFAGVTLKDTVEHVITYVPSETANRVLLFRFSQKLGIVDVDDLAGVPYYISIEDLKTVPETPLMDKKKAAKQVAGIYVNIPGKMRSTISNSEGLLLTNEFPAAQFGNTELLSAALFNKRYTTHLWLNPLSGAVERLDAEQPK